MPQAVVFHAEAAHRGTRRTPLTGRHTHYQERRAALWTLLANAPGALAAVAGGPAAFGTLVRMIGFLLVRSVGEALDELAALLSVYSQPGRAAARRAASGGGRGRDPDGRRRLLAPGGCPTGTASTSSATSLAAATNQAADVADRRRAACKRRPPPPARSRRRGRRGRRGRACGRGHRLVARFFTNPVALALTLFVLLVLVGAREAFGHVTGGGLSPAPATRADCWGLCTRVLAPARRSAPPCPAPAYVAAARRCWPAARQQSGGRGQRRARARRAARRCGAPGGCCAWSAVWLDPAGLAALAGRRAARRLRPGPGASRRLGRRPARARRRSRRCCPGWRTPRSASATRSPTGAGGRPGAPGCCWRWRPRSRPRSAGFAVVLAWSCSRSRSAVARSLPRGPVGVGPPLVALGRGAGAARSVVAAGDPAGSRSAGCCSTPAGCLRRPDPSTCCSGGSTTSAPRPGWRWPVVVGALLALVPRAPGSRSLVSWLVAARRRAWRRPVSAPPSTLPGGAVRPGVAAMVPVVAGAPDRRRLRSAPRACPPAPSASPSAPGAAASCPAAVALQSRPRARLVRRRRPRRPDDRRGAASRRT